MSDLQIILGILGIVVVVGLFLYNNWYISRHSPRQARQLLDEDETRGVRKEPGLPAEPGLEATAAAATPSPAGIDPADAAITPPDAPHTPHADDPANAPFAADAGTAATAATATAAAAPTADASSWQEPQGLDALVFSITPIHLDGLVTGETAVPALPPTRRVGTKQLLIEGYNTKTGLWEAPRAGAIYKEFQAGVQLANRLGALNEIEFSEYVAKVQAFADAIGGAPDFPDMLHEVARAREVDSFAAQNDAILSFMVVAKRSTWSPGYVRQMAAQYGFKPSVTPGRLVVPAANPSAPAVLTLNYDPQAAMADDLDHAPVSEITLTLDVPNVDRSENAFQRLREAVEGLAKTMDGSITDPDGRPLPAMAMNPIQADINHLYDALDARGLCAGSPAAQKLFS